MWLRHSCLCRSHHHRDQFIIGHTGQLATTHAPPVPQNGEPRSNLAHFFEKVADVDDGDAAVAQAADGIEEALDVGALQAAGRLVHQQDARIAGQSTADLDDLLIGERETAGAHARIDLGASEVGEESGGAIVQGIALQPSAA